MIYFCPNYVNLLPENARLLIFCFGMGEGEGEGEGRIRLCECFIPKGLVQKGVKAFKKIKRSQMFLISWSVVRCSLGFLFNHGFITMWDSKPILISWSLITLWGRMHAILCRKCSICRIRKRKISDKMDKKDALLFSSLWWKQKNCWKPILGRKRDRFIYYKNNQRKLHWVITVKHPVFVLVDTQLTCHIIDVELF